ncbi:hypothetical protein L211DRAFT_837788 [Terfezia boudieri ATCC MYA-4762]|uniref:Uncharacterized protein n=1 Tax=Terfezia boudieri ATCC MYA-4762 TaxID=1051890 RepID=A0A3N4LN90_9PEZI|nr:hypothetical protein L211DRAFT_837788 [Terfezia boudieri ATCC MYA-4762]
MTILNLIMPPSTPVGRLRQHRRSRSLPDPQMSPTLGEDSFDHLVQQLDLGRDLVSISQDRHRKLQAHQKDQGNWLLELGENQHEPAEVGRQSRTQSKTSFFWDDYDDSLHSFSPPSPIHGHQSRAIAPTGSGHLLNLADPIGTTATTPSTLARIALQYHNHYMFFAQDTPYKDILVSLGVRPQSKLYFTLAAVTTEEFSQWLTNYQGATTTVKWGPVTVSNESEWTGFLEVLEDHLRGKGQKCRVGVNVE